MAPLIPGDQVSTNVNLVEYHTVIFSSSFCVLFIGYCQTTIVLDIVYISLIPKSLKPFFIVKVGGTDHSPIFCHRNLFPHIFHVLPPNTSEFPHYPYCNLFCSIPIHSFHDFCVGAPIPTILLPCQILSPIFVIYKQQRNKIRNKIFYYRMTHT